MKLIFRSFEHGEDIHITEADQIICIPRVGECVILDDNQPSRFVHSVVWDYVCNRILITLKGIQ